MIRIHTEIQAIEALGWETFAQTARTANWFQTKAAYDFYSAVSNEMRPFAYAVEEDGVLVGVMQGYITLNANPLMQLLTRRAIVVGGPMLARNISPEALRALLLAAKEDLRKQAIYIETRNFMEFYKWRKIFEECGYNYKEHLNFHVHTASIEAMEAGISKNRKRDLKTTIRNGATPVMNPTIEQVRDYYQILAHLYRTRVKTPLSPLSFFEKLYEQKDARFFLVEYQGRIIGGTICVCLEGKAVYEWYVCGEDGKYDHIFPSSYATYLGIRYAAENGYERFDMMGAGKPDEAYGVRDFKARFGGELVEHGRFLVVCKPILYMLGSLGVKILKKR